MNRERGGEKEEKGEVTSPLVGAFDFLRESRVQDERIRKK